MFVSADVCASIPEVPENLCSRGHRGVGEAFVQEQRGIVSAAVRGRAGGSGALSEALQGWIHSRSSL